MILVRKRPVTVEARQVTVERRRGKILAKWCGGLLLTNGSVLVETHDGPMLAMPGDWIIHDANGTYYAVKADSFEDQYDRVLH
jgi:hypothetical protein